MLLLNLYQDAFAILIENKEVAETLKTLYTLASHCQNPPRTSM